MKHIKLLLLPIFFISYILQGTIPWYLTVIKNTPLPYKNKCHLINTAQGIKTTSLQAYSFITHKNYKIDDKIQQKRFDIEQHYRQKEQSILHMLGKSLNFTKQEWDDCLQTIATLKNKVQQQNNQDHVTHDPDIPHTLYNTISTLLINSGLTIENVDLMYDSSDNPYTFAIASSSIVYSYTSATSPFITNPRIKQKIILYKSLAQQSVSDQLAMCAHEVEHLCQGHGITLVVIEQYAQHYLLCGKKVLENNKEYQKLKVLHEEQAEVFAALKNPLSAQALVDLRSKRYYPQHLYVEHYHVLVDINNLWKLKASSKK